jgi:nucleoside 2-deoxyribosyltransferase
MSDWKGKEMKKGFVICSVRGQSEEYRNKLEAFVKEKEAQGWQIHLPHRDTNQNARGYDICLQNAEAINLAHRIFIFYSPNSQGTHFDMGVAFALCKPIEIVETVEYGGGKSYPRMLQEWAEELA